MQCISTRAMVALGYERGEEFDPALMPTRELVEDLGAAGGAIALTSEPGRYERRMLARVPEWFSADDLVPDGMAVIHGEPV